MSVFYVLLMPLLLVQIFAIIFIPSMLVPGAKAGSVGKAIYSYTMQAVGIILMTIGAIPAVHGVIEGFMLPQDRYTTEIYIALLVVFATGGLAFLWHEQMAQTIDDASRKVVSTLFWYLWRTVGCLAIIIAVLSLLLTMLLSVPPFVQGWWIMPVLVFLYGGFLVMATRTPKMVVSSGPSAFPRISMNTPSVSAKKAPPKKKKMEIKL